nr:peptidoglycan-binding protein [Salipaludibacillus sp. CUR1]
MIKKILFCLLAGLLFFVWLIPPPSSAAASSSNQLIIINKSNNQLAFYENNTLMRTFSVATGRTARLTPEGNFRIVNKIVNRPYYTGNIAGGHPSNPLGNRWLGINANGTNGNTYAIHGNNNPSSIGTYASAGCIRMHNNEVRWLYDKVRVNTPVVIVSSSRSFNSIAKANGYSLDGKSGSVPVSSAVTLRRGSRGTSVKQLQEQLTRLGYNTRGVDGIFGPGTESAVRRFQKDKKLTVDGVVGPQTRTAVFNSKSTGTKTSTAKKNSGSTSASQVQQATIRQGSRGAAVTELQRSLRQNGYKITSVDGIFGPETNNAVRRFQRDKKLSVDGIVGPQTWRALR